MRASTRLCLSLALLPAIPAFALAAPAAEPATQPAITTESPTATGPTDPAVTTAEPPATTAPSSATAFAATPASSLFERIKPSLVVVRYRWDMELAPQELNIAGIVVSPDGLVMFPITATEGVPDAQMADFKVIVPSETGEEEELDATFQGRDERTDLAFVKVNAKRVWPAVRFEDLRPPIGDPVYSVGLLPRGAGHKSFLCEANIAQTLRGPVPQILVSGTLASVGGVVLTADGRAIGYVHQQFNQSPLLDNPQNQQEMQSVYIPPKMFIPTSDFAQSLTDPPVAGQPLPRPWLGIPQMSGMNKEVLEFYKLQGTPALQIGDVLPDSPAAAAGLRDRDIIVQFDGKPLVRGDQPEELPAILGRQLNRLKPGDKVTLGVIREAGDAPKPVEVTLGERPKEATAAERFYARDLGFVVRESVFLDVYARKLPPKTQGVVVALLKPQGPAQTAHLQMGDFVTQVNGTPVTTLEAFRKEYQSFRKDHPHDPAVLVVRRRAGTETVNIEPPQGGPTPARETAPAEPAEPQ